MHPALSRIWRTGRREQPKALALAISRMLRPSATRRLISSCLSTVSILRAIRAVRHKRWDLMRDADRWRCQIAALILGEYTLSNLANALAPAFTCRSECRSVDGAAQFQHTDQIASLRLA